MKLIRKLTEFPSHLRGGALSIGNFDGVHRGHAQLLQRLTDRAKWLDGPATVLTFDPHPALLLNPDRAPVPLTWTDRKAELLGSQGVDVVIAYPTDLELLSLEYYEFFDRIVVDRLGARAMVEGPNFFFGKDRRGDVDQLQKLCQQAGLQLEIVPPVQLGGDYISSSRIRQLIREGQVGLAREMLTQPYRLRGMVTHGAGRGRSLGFPTANLDAVDTLVPGMGVYAGRAIVDHTSRWSAIHIGPSPTYGDDVPKIEVHILDFDGSLYGQTIEVEFIQQIRPARRFANGEELQQQVRRDVETTRQISQEYRAKAS